MLPPLRDVKLIAVRGDTMTLTGCEAVMDGMSSDEAGAILHAQSWMLVAITESQAATWWQRQREAGRTEAG